MNSRRSLLAGIILALTLIPAAAADPTESTESAFLVLKTGERDATPKKAGRFIDELGRYLAPGLGAGKLHGHITNKPQEALALVERQHPIFGIVTPAFFLEHETRFDLKAVAETRRLGKDGEVFVLVRRKGAPPLAAGQAVATTLAAEQTYLMRVVFPAMDPPVPPNPKLKSVRNVADAVYDLTEEGAGEVSAVLLDRATLDFFRADPQVWPKLEVGGTTSALPADLVVAFGNSDRSERLWTALEKILGDEEGRRICLSLQTEGFARVEPKRLDGARKRYRADDTGSK